MRSRTSCADFAVILVSLPNRHYGGKSPTHGRVLGPLQKVCFRRRYVIAREEAMLLI